MAPAAGGGVATATGGRGTISRPSNAKATQKQPNAAAAGPTGKADGATRPAAQHAGGTYKVCSSTFGHAPQRGRELNRARPAAHADWGYSAERR